MDIKMCIGQLDFLEKKNLVSDEGCKALSFAILVLERLEKWNLAGILAEMVLDKKYYQSEILQTNLVADALLTELTKE